ncbi:alginate export family protein [Caulobacter sp. S45]|uniref:alginate export family protein n=1 Tax=Caulobacter sp. S45 TaxID=1641861 RepID=UPI001C203A9B|nr:alginate export family protein [Caulobacter sp. S45]
MNMIVQLDLTIKNIGRGNMRRFYLHLCACVALTALTHSGAALAQTEVAQPSPIQADVLERGAVSPTAPNDPYPIEAAGWSKPRSFQFFDSRWEEDWSKLQKEGKAPPLKAMPLLGDEVTLTLSAEDRLRAHFYGNGQLTDKNNYTELQNRTIVGADLHITDHFRLYTELGHADLSENGHPDVQSVSAKQDNSLSLQQMFGEFREEYKGVLVGAMIGRQEYTDAPEQLISAGNGPNLHQTWNGYRFYIHTDRFRLGYFTAYPTDQNFGKAFNQTISHEEYIRSVTGSAALVSMGNRYNIFLDPLYIESFNKNLAAGPTTGEDHRFTYGSRLWGRIDRLTFDWMAYKQTGFHIGREVDAWMASLTQNVKVSPLGFPSTFGFRLDGASGGDAFNKTGTTHLFDPIYTDKGIFGEAELFSYQNIFIIAPTASVRLTPKFRINAEYDFIWRMAANDAFYTPTKAYTGTQNVAGKYAGGMVRINNYYDLTSNIFLRLELDQMSVGTVLRRAHFSDAYVVMPDLTFRY